MASLSTLAESLQPDARRLFDHARERGLNPRVTSARRSRRDQAYLYRQHLAGRLAFPAAPPGHSKHEVGLAFDMVVDDLAELAALGRLWRSWGHFWTPADPIHFQA